VTGSGAGNELEQLTALVARLPGLGPRSARRVVLHLLKHREAALQPLAAALERVDAALVECPVCGNLDVVAPCRICTDPRRDAGLLCVVADVADLWALERGRLFSGRFHVLGGSLSALDGVGPDALSIDALLLRIAADPPVREVVLAMNATLEGQTTAHYVAERLQPTGVAVTQLAHGMPVGGELDYLDEGTLQQALRLRRPLS
jgi:recombination protein RecR